MKKLFFGSIALLSFSYGIAQDKLNTLFQSSEARLLWLGLDYSHVKLVGPSVFLDPEHIRNYYFVAWNDLILMESEKYNIKQAFRKSYIPFDLGMVTKINSKVEWSDLVISKTYVIGDSEIKKIVQNYPLEPDSGIGLIFIMESLDKYSEMASMYVTLFDLSTKEVLISERMTGRAGGVGFRNYWAKPIFEVIEHIRDRRWIEWKNRSLGIEKKR